LTLPGTGRARPVDGVDEPLDDCRDVLARETPDGVRLRGDNGVTAGVG